MFPPKKKPVMGGGPKPELSAPGPIDKMPMAKKSAPPAEPVDDEASESPDQESAEESGASLISDMVSPLVESGMDESTAKEALCGVLLAICSHLRGGDGVAQHDAGGSDMEGSSDDYGQ